MAHLSAKEREMYSSVFLSMDKDGNGWLSLLELAEGCRRLGFSISDEEAEVRAAQRLWDGSRVADDVELNVLGCRLTCLGQTVTNACAWFNVALHPQKP